jgi:hypothetical protein
MPGFVAPAEGVIDLTIDDDDSDDYEEGAMGTQGVLAGRISSVTQPRPKLASVNQTPADIPQPSHNQLPKLVTPSKSTSTLPLRNGTLGTSPKVTRVDHPQGGALFLLDDGPRKVS